MLAYIIFMLLYGFTAQLDLEVSTFSFYTNRLYGNTLPQKVTIEVRYSLNFTTSERKHDHVLKLKTFPREGGLTKLTAGPFMCTTGIDNKIVEASSVSTYNAIKSKLRKFRESDEIPDSPSPIINASDCRNLKSIVEVNTFRSNENDVYVSTSIFNITYVFKRFDTILFVDSFNVVPFHYLPNHNDGMNPTAQRSSNPASCDLITGDQIPFEFLQDRHALLQK